MKRSCLLLFCVAALSCAKDKSLENGPQIPLPEAFNNKEWIITSIVLTSTDGAYLDLFNIAFRDCEKDDILGFPSSGNFTLSDNTNVCSPAGSSVFVNLNGGNWDVSAPDSLLAIAKGFNQQVYKVTRWSATDMTWIQEANNYLGIRETLTYKLRAK